MKTNSWTKFGTWHAVFTKCTLIPKLAKQYKRNASDNYCRSQVNKSQWPSYVTWHTIFTRYIHTIILVRQAIGYLRHVLDNTSDVPRSEVNIHIYLLLVCNTPSLLEPHQAKKCLWLWAKCTDSGHPVHTPQHVQSIIQAFALHSYILW